MSCCFNFCRFSKKLSVFLSFQVHNLVQMSKWQNLISSKLTDSEKEYFRGKNDDGMCFTAKGHRCFVGMVPKKCKKYEKLP